MDTVGSQGLSGESSNNNLVSLTFFGFHGTIINNNYLFVIHEDISIILSIVCIKYVGT